MCSDFFSRTANARRHIGTALSKRCPDCLLSFANADALVEHASDAHHSRAPVQVSDEWQQAHKTWVNSRLRAWSNDNARTQMDPAFAAAASSSPPSTPWDTSMGGGATAGTGTEAPVEAWHFVPGSILLAYSDGDRFTICLDPSQRSTYPLRSLNIPDGTLVKPPIAHPPSKMSLPQVSECF